MNSVTFDQRAIDTVEWRLTGRRQGTAVLAVTRIGPDTFVGTTGGVARMKPGSEWEWIGSALAPTTHLNAVTSGTLLAGTTLGVHRWEGDDKWRWLLELTQLTGVTSLLDRLAGDVILASSATDGILRSVDGGASWQTACAGLTDVRVTCMAAGTNASPFVVAGTRSGVYVSHNDGRSWRWAQPAGDGEVLAVRVSSSGDIYVLTDDARIQVSGNAGHTWSVLDATLPARLELDDIYPLGDGLAAVSATGEIHDLQIVDGRWTVASLGAPPGGCLALSVDDTCSLLVGTSDGVQRRDDKGWCRVGGDFLVGVPGILISGLRGRRLYWATCGDGLAISEDGGMTWVKSGVPDGCVTGVVEDQDGTTWVSTATGVYRQRSATWRLVEPRGTLGVHLDAGTLLAVTDEGGLVASTIGDDADAVWRELPGPPAPVQGLASWEGALFALCAVPERRGWRRSVWVGSPGADGLWAPVLAALTQAPISMAATAHTMFFSVGSSLMALRRGETRARMVGSVVDSTGPAVVTVLCVCGTAVVAATMREVVISSDEGLTWTSVWQPAEPVVSLVAGELTVAGLDQAAQVWISSRESLDELAAKAQKEKV